MFHPYGFDWCCLTRWAKALMVWLTGYCRDDTRLHWWKDEQESK
jgi:hypothetical protein